MPRTATVQRRPPPDRWGCLNDPCNERHDAVSRVEPSWQRAHSVRVTIPASPAREVKARAHPRVRSSVEVRILRLKCPICGAGRMEPCFSANPEVPWLQEKPFGTHPARRARFTAKLEAKEAAANA